MDKKYGYYKLKPQQVSSFSSPLYKVLGLVEKYGKVKKKLFMKKRSEREKEEFPVLVWLVAPKQASIAGKRRALFYTLVLVYDDSRMMMTMPFCKNKMNV